ncbi:hypothetical protein KP509_15G046000 [Ceratopteris richardii]|uniref:Nuclear nucleic acid-binding protein C1D n=1 Tax=Ceratopteris richardii TaxID=49495 RepID=A0A8T2T7C6_CERRI|nr:hypothetical protein KP509_15G046000 [Ceratopteris richardii]
MAVPEEVSAAVLSVSAELEALEEDLQRFTDLLQQPSTFAALPYLQRSSSFLSLSKVLNSLFAVHLRCKGISPEDHPTKFEVERVDLYDNKIGHFIDDLKGRRHRSVVVNLEAANRVIEHAIPDLTDEQKKGLQGIKRQCVGAKKSKNLFGKPIRPARVESITEAAAAFLEAAQKEILEQEKDNEGSN